jgi:hypothetical protein
VTVGKVEAMPSFEEMRQMSAQEALESMQLPFQGRQSISIHMVSDETMDAWLQRVASSIRAHIEPDLVDDITLHGQSWKGLLDPT